MMGPLVVGEDAVEHHEMHALVVEAVILRTEKFLPVFAQIQVVVMFAHYVMHLAGQGGEDFRAVVQFGLGAKLCQIATEHDEFRFGLQ